jgi:hypothetical protein
MRRVIVIVSGHVDAVALVGDAAVAVAPAKGDGHPHVWLGHIHAPDLLQAWDRKTDAWQGGAEKQTRGRGAEKQTRGRGAEKQTRGREVCVCVCVFGRDDVGNS